MASKARWLNNEPGTHAKNVGVSMEFMKLPKIDLYEAGAEEKLRDICDRYLAICQQQDYPPSRESFAVAIHIPLMYLSKIINGTARRPVASGVQEVLIEMDMIFQMIVADGMLNNNLNTLGSIFELKNHWGYKDQTEVVSVQRNETLTGAELKALADNLPEVIDVEYHEVNNEE